VIDAESKEYTIRKYYNAKLYVESHIDVDLTTALYTVFNLLDSEESRNILRITITDRRNITILDWRNKKGIVYPEPVTIPL